MKMQMLDAGSWILDTWSRVNKQKIPTKALSARFGEVIQKL